MNRKAGDWNCKSCNHLNFSRRDTCQHCGLPRIGVPAGFNEENQPPPRMVEFKPGDWYCCSCCAHNYASRYSCFKCGASKVASNAGAPSSGHGSRPPGWKSGDWICNRLGCNEHNFASRSECFRCNTPRENIGG
ncbi:zinc finger Ran-binding domain-containing protein 2 [Dendrobium catenatum]|uniref:Zinc finger protein VAR3, chloroplastic n=1 Tax=Dendrobium catenatum TaxID=906689 RepID=A0A2I0VFZ5_9ASPA|nr:zinc finger Ran-binding domain-containing protein 2 [Dendrobium catenatum]PKU62346.1 Zinc finger protein VAR3, chloroplastic [Dendrobium catenatum]